MIHVVILLKNVTSIQSQTLLKKFEKSQMMFNIEFIRSCDFSHSLEKI